MAQNIARIDSLLITDGQTRYVRFIETNPKLAARISVSDLSSYLGMSRQMLTRIRKNWAIAVHNPSLVGLMLSKCVLTKWIKMVFYDCSSKLQVITCSTPLAMDYIFLGWVLSLVYSLGDLCYHQIKRHRPSKLPKPKRSSDGGGSGTSHIDNNQNRLSANGIVAAVETAEVSSQISGVAIERVLVEVGEFVKAGQVLATLDTRTFEQQLSSAEAELATAVAAQEKAAADLARTEPLLAIDAVSRQEVDAYRTALRQALANVTAAQAHVESARTNQ